MPRCKDVHNYPPWKPCSWGHHGQQKYVPLTDKEFKERVQYGRENPDSFRLNIRVSVIWFRKCINCGKEEILFKKASDPRPRDDWHTKVKKRQRQQGVPEREPKFGRKPLKESMSRDHYRY